MGLSKTQRNLISRGTLLLVGAVFLYWGYCVFDKGSELRAEWKARQQASRDDGVSPRQRDSSGAAHLSLFGFVLFGVGGCAVALAAVPTAWLAMISVAPASGRAFNDRWKSDGGGW